MEHEKDHSETFEAGNEEQDADQHLIDAEEDDERMERHERKRQFEESGDERICRAQEKELQYPEPEKNDEERDPGEGHVHTSVHTESICQKEKPVKHDVRHRFL